MNINKLFHLKFYKFNWKQYTKLMKKEEEFNATFRNGTKKLTRSNKKDIEYIVVKTYRKFQVNKGNLWGYIYSWKLDRLCQKTGIDFMQNCSFGPGLIIGHWGRIVINGNAQFGSQTMLTHNVTIGRDIRGKRAGAPTFGDRVVIRTNSTVTGNIKIGDDVLVAPNTFVNFDVPSHSIVIGNPATIHSRTNATEGHIGVLENE